MNPRLSVLDGARLFSALAVLLFHYVSMGREYWGPSGTELEVIRYATDYGWLGVNFFFMISGFVICFSAWGRSVGQFAAARVVRLYPAYLAAVVTTTAVLWAWPGPAPAPSVPDVIANLTMLQQPLGVPNVEGTYWTLWRELTFYLLFAVVVWRGLTYERVVAFCALWLISTVLFWTSEPSVPTTLVNASYSPYFIGGILLSLIWRFGLNAILAGLLLVTIVLALLSVDRQAADYSNLVGHSLSGTVAAIVVLCCFGFLLLTAMVSRSTSGRWERVLASMGALTYPLYLLHQSIGLNAIARLAPYVSPAMLLVTLTAAMLLAAWAMHKVVEKPLSKRLRRAIEAGMRRQSRTPLRGLLRVSPD